MKLTPKPEVGRGTYNTEANVRLHRRGVSPGRVRSQRAKADGMWKKAEVSRTT